MRPGDILCYRTKSKSGKTIRWIQRRLLGKGWWSEINHVARVVAAPNIVKEAVIPRSVVHPEDSVGDREIIAIIRPNYLALKPGVDLQAVLRDLPKSGKVYGIFQIVGFLVYSSLRICSLNPKSNPIKGGWICTEDEYWNEEDLANAYGVPNCLDEFIKEPNSILPGELALAFYHSQSHRTYIIVPDEGEGPNPPPRLVRPS